MRGHSNIARDLQQARCCSCCSPISRLAAKAKGHSAVTLFRESIGVMRCGDIRLLIEALQRNLTQFSAKEGVEMTVPTAFESTVNPQDWEPFEVGEVHWIRKEDGDAGFVQVGLWRATPEQQPDIHEAVFQHNETVHILKGRVRVEIVGGPAVELSAGGIASFVKGTTGRWKILEPVLEFFIYH